MPTEQPWLNGENIAEWTGNSILPGLPQNLASQTWGSPNAPHNRFPTPCLYLPQLSLGKTQAQVLALILA